MIYILFLSFIISLFTSTARYFTTKYETTACRKDVLTGLHWPCCRKRKTSLASLTFQLQSKLLLLLLLLFYQFLLAVFFHVSLASLAFQL